MKVLLLASALFVASQACLGGQTRKMWIDGELVTVTPRCISADLFKAASQLKQDAADIKENNILALSKRDDEAADKYNSEKQVSEEEASQDIVEKADDVSQKGQDILAKGQKLLELASSLQAELDAASDPETRASLQATVDSVTMAANDALSVGLEIIRANSTILGKLQGVTGDINDAVSESIDDVSDAIQQTAESFKHVEEKLGQVLQSGGTASRAIQSAFEEVYSTGLLIVDASQSVKALGVSLLRLGRMVVGAGISIVGSVISGVTSNIVGGVFSGIGKIGGGLLGIIG